MLKSQVSEGSGREVVCCARDSASEDPLRLLQSAIGAHNKHFREDMIDKSQCLAHLSKRTRIELIGATNDHNYNLPSPKLQSSASCGADELEAKEALSSLNDWKESPKEERMDDCMAAMVLMFLSCNNEQLKPHQSKVNKTTLKQNSEPIEMDTSSQQKLYQRHFKRRLYSANCSNQLLASNSLADDERSELECDLRVGVARPRPSGHERDEAWRARRRLNSSLSDEEEEEEEEEFGKSRREPELLFEEGEARSATAKVEDEMIFELQQVDDDDDEQPEEPISRQLSGNNNQAGKFSLIDRKPNLEVQQVKQIEDLKIRRELEEELEEKLINDERRRDIERPLPAVCPQTAAALNLPNSSSSNNNNNNNKHQLHLRQHQLRFRINNPVKTRTIFSCMWPKCTKNYDSLEDTERHVRAHFGPRQCDAIGDEDFYYEETEVDEATYLAIFNRSSTMQMSPSHNSDGLSSSQSFASSSPATSPVCSTDSSSSSSSSSCSSSYPASQLYANSIDWNHFLADQQSHHHQHQLTAAMRNSPAPNKWLSKTSAQLSASKYQQQQVYRFGCHASELGRARCGLKKASAGKSQLSVRLLSSGNRSPRPRSRVGVAAQPASQSPQQTNTTNGTGTQLQFSMQLSANSEPIPVVLSAKEPSGALYKRQIHSTANQTSKHHSNNHLNKLKQQQPVTGSHNADHLYSSPEVGLKPEAPDEEPISEQEQTSLNHLKHNLSQRFFHNQSTSSQQQQQQQLNKPKQIISSAPTQQQQLTTISNNAPSTHQLANQQLITTATGGQNLSVGRRGRGENRKCRKVYGMERRDLWCTQCKWKKACSRFCDH